jgi:hypothetical protein
MEPEVSEYVALLKEKTRLTDKLIRLEDWLVAHEHHPKYAEREQVWINALRKYERTIDAMSRIERSS